MAGAMRRMGIYLGLVEDDDARGYGRYDARQSEHDDRDRRYGRYADDDYDEHYADGDYDGRLRRRPRGRGAAAGARARAAAGPPGRHARPLGLAPPAGAGRPVADRCDERRQRSAAPWAAGPSAPPRPSSPSASRSRPASRRPRPAPQPYRITTLHPRTYNEARTIGERFRDGMPVIMNLTEMDDADAKRLVDFAAGLSFGLRGSIERVTAKVFLLSPQNVDVTAEDKARIREGGFFNQS